ncbi:hypothetical protein [Sphingobacterium sp. SGR-19]|nr:hypothetical protein [Sphingobacterium sp. SGR-19]NGM66835.1 hypothetical protein [Sphingobacterium sp. SGR-19]
MLNSRKTAVSSPREKAERKKSGGLGGSFTYRIRKTCYYSIGRTDTESRA